MAVTESITNTQSSEIVEITGSVCVDNAMSVDAETDTKPQIPADKKKTPSGRRRPTPAGGGCGGGRFRRTGSAPRAGRSSQRKRERDNTTTSSERAAVDYMQLTVLPDNVSLGGVRFQWKRRRMMSIPDVGATAQTLAKATVGSDPSKFVPNIIKNTPGMEISVFHILDEELEQPFTLNNGMILQEALYYWLMNYRSSCAAQFDVVHNLYQARESLLVWWEGRCVRIWCWPYEMRPALVCMTRCVLAVLARIVHIELTEPASLAAPSDDAAAADTEATADPAASSSSSSVAVPPPQSAIHSNLPCKTPHVFTSFDDPLCVRCTNRSISAMRTDFWPITIVTCGGGGGGDPVSN